MDAAAEILAGLDPNDCELIDFDDDDNTVVVTAVLCNAYLHTSITEQYLTGEVYFDKRKRFEDGTFIHTASVKRIGADLYSSTTGSIYQVRGWSSAQT